MIKLRDLILEELSAKEFHRMFILAYSTIFDIEPDDIYAFKRSEWLGPPFYAHRYYTLSVGVKYNKKSYFIYHKFMYLKYPRKELEKLTRDQWDAAIKQSDAFKRLDVDNNSIKQRNILYSFSTSVYESSRPTLMDAGTHLGEEHDLHSISDVVIATKKIIDRSNGGSGSDEIEPTPVEPSNKLVPV